MGLGLGLGLDWTGTVDLTRFAAKHFLNLLVKYVSCQETFTGCWLAFCGIIGQHIMQMWQVYGFVLCICAVYSLRLRLRFCFPGI